MLHLLSSASPAAAAVARLSVSLPLSKQHPACSFNWPRALKTHSAIARLGPSVPSAPCHAAASLPFPQPLPHSVRLKAMASNGPGWPPNNQQPPPPEQQPEQPPQQRRRWRRPGPVSVAPVRLASLSGEHDVIGGGSDSGSPRQGDWRRQRQHRAEELFSHYEGERGLWQGALLPWASSLRSWLAACDLTASRSAVPLPLLSEHGQLSLRCAAVPFDRPDIPFEPSRTLDVDARKWRHYTQHGTASGRPRWWQLCSAWLQRTRGRLWPWAGGRTERGGSGGGEGLDGEKAAAGGESGTPKRSGGGGSGGGSEAEAAEAAEAAEEGTASSAPSELEAWKAEKMHRHRSMLGLPMISPGERLLEHSVCCCCWGCGDAQASFPAAAGRAVPPAAGHTTGCPGRCSVH